MTVRLAPIAEWTAIILASLAIAAGAIALLSGFFAGRDQPGVSGSAGGPGIAVRDLGNSRLLPGQPRPRYDSNPPTSGPHAPEPVGAEYRPLNDDQLLQALAAGDVVIMYGTPSPPPALRELARAVAPFTPALAAQGEAVILAPRPGVAGVLALAWAHMLQVRSAADPGLREFAQYWLGRGAGTGSHNQ